jgi:hypothetical protein
VTAEKKNEKGPSFHMVEARNRKRRDRSGMYIRGVYSSNGILNIYRAAYTGEMYSSE